MRFSQLAGFRVALLVVLLVPGLLQAQLSEHEKDKALVEMLRWKNSDDATTARYLIVVSVAIAVGYGIFLGHKRYRTWARRRPSRRRWDESLGRYGLDPVERDFVQSLATRMGIQEATEILRNRGAFERAIGAAGVDFTNDPYMARTVNAIRTKLGAEAPRQGEPIPSTQLLQPDQEMELFGIGLSAGYCVRTILVHCDPQHLMVRVLDRVTDLPWTQGQKIQAYFWRDNDAGYYFQSDILEVRQQRQVYLLLSHPTSLERKQKRMYVRARHEVMFEYRAIPASSAAHMVGQDPDGDYERDGRTEDISAGGFRFVTANPVQIGDLVSVQEFPPANGAEVLATVVNDLGTTEEGQHRYGARFSGISVSTREAITRFVFESQRQQIREHLEAAPATQQAPKQPEQPQRQEPQRRPAPSGPIAPATATDATLARGPAVTPPRDDETRPVRERTTD